MRSVDYIVIGGGSSGCVVARRLSEQPGVRVLLLEAGPQKGPSEMAIPAGWTKLFNSKVEWGMKTAPQRHLNNREIYFPRGKVLGGSSGINVQIWLRGHAADYDEWSRLGNAGWSHAEVLPYFRMSERCLPAASEVGRTATRGHGGPVHINNSYTPNPLSQAFIAAGESLGLPRRKDFNAGEMMGVGLCEYNHRNGKRHSAADAYLRDLPGDSRFGTLEIQCGVNVSRILLDGHRAVGVEFMQDGRKQTIYAMREIVLSAGAVHSPQLLMLSGIGPGAELSRHGIAVKHELPGVGANFHDHPVLPLTFRSREPVSLLVAESFANIAKYLLLKRGMLATGGVEGLIHLNSREGFASRSGAPDTQLLMVNALWQNEGLTPPTEHGFSIAVSAIKPVSRGSIALRTADPLQAPKIDPNFLAAEEDRMLIRRAVRYARDVANAGPFSRFNAGEVEPGTLRQSDSQLDAFIEQRLQTYYHPVGSCRMGTDAQAVVDAQLRVHGIDGLRIVDASIMPSVPRANTNATCIMIGEKGADMIARSALTTLRAVA